MVQREMRPGMIVQQQEEVAREGEVQERGDDPQGARRAGHGHGRGGASRACPSSGRARSRATWSSAEAEGPRRSLERRRPPRGHGAHAQGGPAGLLARRRAPRRPDRDRGPDQNHEAGRDGAQGRRHAAPQLPVRVRATSWSSSRSRCPALARRRAAGAGVVAARSEGAPAGAIFMWASASRSSEVDTWLSADCGFRARNLRVTRERLASCPPQVAGVVRTPLTSPLCTWAKPDHLCSDHLPREPRHHSARRTPFARRV